MKTINQFTLRYAEKTSQHLFTKIKNDKVVEYMKVKIVEIEGEKALMIVTLNENFHVKHIQVDTGRFINYVEGYKDGLLKYEADVWLRVQIFGYGKGEYRAVPGTFKIEDGLGRKLPINRYIDEVVEFFLKQNFFQVKREEVLNDGKNNRYGWIRGLLSLPDQPKDVQHFRLDFVNSKDTLDNPINTINQRHKWN